MLTAVVLIARLILAAVFAVAGIAKLRDRAGTRRAVVGFGVPVSIAAPLALALPLAELVVAVFLVPASTQLVGAVGALVLLAVFSVAIAINLARGRSPECQCFGQLHSAPAGWKTLGRNGLLAALGLVVFAEALGGSRPSFVSLGGGVDAAALPALAGGIVAIGFALAFLSVTRSYGRVLLRLDTLERRLAEAGMALEDEEPEAGLAPGTPVPSFGAVEELLTHGRPVLLLFTSPTCAPCKALMPTIETWQIDHGDEITVTTTEDERIHAAFGVNASPSAVLVAADGTVASWVVAGADAIDRLLERVLGKQQQMGLPIGASAPALTLPKLGGGTLALDKLAGKETVLLFWNPDCGYCRSMHEDVLAWERRADAQSRRLVIIASGSEEATAAEGFASTVVLDPEFTAGEAFRAGGTPTAVLLDTAGKVASPPAAGAEAVLALGQVRDPSPRHAHALEGVAA